MKSLKWSGVLMSVMLASPIGFANDMPAKTPESKMFELNVHYDTGKADIKPKYGGEIKKVAEELANYPAATAMIQGYADSVGPEAYNKELSMKRADSVKAYLVSHYQIDAKRLTTAGFGETKSVAENSTKEGRQRNRVVLVTVNRLITTTQDQNQPSTH